MNHRGVHQSNSAGPAAPGQVRTHHSQARSQPSQARPHQSRPQQASRPQLATAGHTWPGLGPAAPLGAPAPIKCHVSGPRHQQSHEQVLDGRETSILCRLDQKAKVASTWIDGPTLNRHNCHSKSNPECHQGKAVHPTA
jgi:hypothetical protein